MASLDTPAGTDDKQSEAGSPMADRRVAQLLALNQAAIAITGELDLDELLQRIVDAARALVGCKYSALGVLGDDGFIARFPTSGISATEREKLGAPPRGHGLLGVMLRAGHTLRIPRISEDPRRSGFPPHHPPMTSLLGVPIFVQGKLAGDLYLTDKYDGPEFTEEDEWLVQLLSTHAATALTNAQLHAENTAALRRVSRERARTQALLTVNQAINRSVHMDEVIRLIVQSTVDLLDAAGAAFYVLQQSGPGAEGALDTDGQEAAIPSFSARYGIGLEEAITTESSLLPFQRSVAGRAVASGLAQVVADARTEPDTVFPRLKGKILRSLIAVPLVSANKALGVLSAYSERLDAFDEEAVTLLEAFGAMASIAVHNATLYEEAQRGREVAEREGQRLRELERMKDEFLSTAAHELRTPLTSIRMSAGLVQEQLQLMVSKGSPQVVDPRLLDLIALVEDGSQRMHSLVNDLLDLTRLEQGRATLLIEELDMREVVKASVEATMPLFESKGQHLSMHLPEAYCAVRGDRQRLEQVIINLLSNAHKYSPAGARIDVRIQRSGGECSVSVRDNGPGIPEEERELIFERFYRSSLHRRDRTPSTGLGLPIARKIAEMHKGRVWTEAAQGGGSIFTLKLPLHA